MTDPNLKSFRRPGIVSYYQQLQQLQPAEAAFLQTIESRLATMTVLDLGVGGGRTSQYLAHRVADYTGIDYSPEMIEGCQKRFGNGAQSIRFEVADVRDMSRFPDRHYDLIWFSFNGIDNISHTDRLHFFQNIQRIGKPGGLFFFSTHNLDAIESDFQLQTKLSWNPFSTYVNLVMWVFLRFFNNHLSPSKLKSLSHAIIRDESHNYRLRQYYIRPHAQATQLQEYFHQVQVYPWQSGEEVSPDALHDQTDLWLYYLCTIP